MYVPMYRNRRVWFSSLATRIFILKDRRQHTHREEPRHRYTRRISSVLLFLSLYALTPKRVCDLPADRASVPEHAQRREDERARHWPGGRAKGGGGGRRA